VITTREDLIALAFCAAAFLAGLALFLIGVWIDPARRIHRSQNQLSP
jgi:hypothetical protein